jgi:hypothetical protein
MPHEIHFVPSPGLLHVIVRGEFDYAESRRILADLAAAAGRRPTVPILVDTREAVAMLSATDTYNLASELVEAGVSTSTRLAIVNNPRPDFDRASFLQEIGKHRGLQLRHFHAVDSAVAWLTG